MDVLARTELPVPARGSPEHHFGPKKARQGPRTRRPIASQAPGTAPGGWGGAAPVRPGAENAGVRGRRRGRGRGGSGWKLVVIFSTLCFCREELKRIRVKNVFKCG